MLNLEALATFKFSYFVVTFVHHSRKQGRKRRKSW